MFTRELMHRVEAQAAQLADFSTEVSDIVAEEVRQVVGERHVDTNDTNLLVAVLHDSLALAKLARDAARLRDRMRAQLPKGER